MTTVLWALLWFAVLGGVLGGLLALFCKLFAVKKDARVAEIDALLPNANCGGCGYSGCAAFAEAVVRGEATPTGCRVASGETLAAVGAVMGIEVKPIKRMRAQVMCSGTIARTAKQYHYDGVRDCYAAAKLGGGDKACPNGCIGLGSCVAACKFDALYIADGIAHVRYDQCRGCGVCACTCPQGIIRLIPFDSKLWVGCVSAEKGALTKSYCTVGCVACKLCERVCPSGAISVKHFRAIIDYEKCTECGACAAKCPRHIIKTAGHLQGAQTAHD